MIIEEDKYRGGEGKRESDSDENRTEEEETREYRWNGLSEAEQEILTLLRDTLKISEL